MNYWMVQYPFCHNRFNTSNPLLIVKGVKPIENPPWDYYFAWSLVVVLLLILIAIGFFNRHILQSYYQSYLNYVNGSRQGKDSDKKENVSMKESSPRDIQPSRTVGSNGPSLNHTNNKFSALNVEERYNI